LRTACFLHEVTFCGWKFHKFVDFEYVLDFVVLMLVHIGLASFINHQILVVSVQTLHPLLICSEQVLETGWALCTYHKFQ
jgi:hypothetical protein